MDDSSMYIKQPTYQFRPQVKSMPPARHAPEKSEKLMDTSPFGKTHNSERLHPRFPYMIYNGVERDVSSIFMETSPNARHKIVHSEYRKQDKLQTTVKKGTKAVKLNKQPVYEDISESESNDLEKVDQYYDHALTNHCVDTKKGNLYEGNLYEDISDTEFVHNEQEELSQSENFNQINSKTVSPNSELLVLTEVIKYDTGCSNQEGSELFDARNTSDGPVILPYVYIDDVTDDEYT